MRKLCMWALLPTFLVCGGFELEAEAQLGAVDSRRSAERRERDRRRRTGTKVLNESLSLQSAERARDRRRSLSRSRRMRDRDQRSLRTVYLRRGAVTKQVVRSRRPNALSMRRAPRRRSGTPSMPRNLGGATARRRMSADQRQASNVAAYRQSSGQVSYDRASAADNFVSRPSSPLLVRNLTPLPGVTPAGSRRLRPSTRTDRRDGPDDGPDDRRRRRKREVEPELEFTR